MGGGGGGRTEWVVKGGVCCPCGVVVVVIGFWRWSEGCCCQGSPVRGKVADCCDCCCCCCWWDVGIGCGDLSCCIDCCCCWFGCDCCCCDIDWRADCCDCSCVCWCCWSVEVTEACCCELMLLLLLLALLLLSVTRGSVEAAEEIFRTVCEMSYWLLGPYRVIGCCGWGLFFYLWIDVVHWLTIVHAGNNISLRNECTIRYLNPLLI